jgi:hypothetical protein
VGEAVAGECRVESFGETWSSPKDEAIAAALDTGGSEGWEGVDGVPREANRCIMVIAKRPTGTVVRRPPVVGRLKSVRR